MTITDALIRALYTPSPPPHGWLNELPEAFAAVDDKGEVTMIGYRGEWYFTRKPSLRVRLRNWLIRRGEVEPDGNTPCPHDYLSSDSSTDPSWRCDQCGAAFDDNESAPGPDIDGGIDLTEDEFQAFLRGARGDERT